MTGADIYMKTCKEKALEWNVSPRSVNDMCKKGRIQGAIKEKEYGWKPVSSRKKPVKKSSEYTYAFIGVIIGLTMGIITSIFMYRDAERCNSLLEENKLLKEMLYYKKINK